MRNRTGLVLIAAGLITAGTVYATAHYNNEFETRLVTAQENLITSGQWSYMPGSEIKPDGLHIAYRDFRIVEQDGSGGQPNPAVNEYGTHLRVPDNFVLTAKLDDILGSVSLQLYASPPMVSDEFRVEPKSISLMISGDKLTAHRWDEDVKGDLANQRPIEEKMFSIPSEKNMVLTLAYKNGSLAISVDGKAVGTMLAGDTFRDGNIWLGADTKTAASHFTISDLRAETQNGRQISAIDTSKGPRATQRDGLQKLADKRRDGFLIGTNAALWAMVSNPAYRQRILGGDFGIVTPENELKWQFVEPQPNVFDFHQADALVAEAKKHNLQVHGHNLVFSEALPHWAQELPTDTPEQKAQVKRVLVNHVTNVVNHFKGTINEWDINEIFTNRDNVFYRALGFDYVRITAQTAYAANSNVRIWINDNSMENDDGDAWQEVVDLFKKWKQADVPVYGFGFQAHIYDVPDDLIVAHDGRAPTLKKHIQQLAELGVMSRISEADAPLTGDYDRSSQSKQFVGELKTCIELPSCKAFSFWSIGPTDLYQDDDRRLQKTAIDSPFGPTMQPTHAYDDLRSFLR
jgi:endo-1,4-beta-xylanase